MWLQALGYISFIIELLSLVALAGRTPNQELARQAADILFRAVNRGLGGKAQHVIDKDKLTNAVAQIVDVIDDVL
jgi:hypothetical protein